MVKQKCLKFLFQQSNLYGTLYPICKWRSLALGWYRKSMRSPLSRTMYFAPGYVLKPRWTSSVNLTNTCTMTSYSHKQMTWTILIIF